MPCAAVPLLRRCAPAALLAFVLSTAIRAQEDLDADVRDALDKARPALLAHLRAAVDASTRPGELALVLLAAIHDGVGHGESAFDRAVARLAKANPPQTYDLALRLMVLEALPTFPDRAETAARDAKRLLMHRTSDGPFGYDRGSGSWDLSNTQYAALGLRSAVALGVDVERAVWRKLAREIGEQQDAYGGFGYRRRNHGFSSYASMTAAGIAVLAICRQHLDGTKSEIDARIERGWKWFARNPDTIGRATERWSLYFHYGLERAAILTDVTEIGGQDWYRKGAAMLLELQSRGGGWSDDRDASGNARGHGRGSAVPTAFAILFLRRKFQKQAGPITPHVVRLVNLGPHSKDADVEVCAAGLVQQGRSALPEVLAALRSDVVTWRRAAALALRGITGESFGYDPAKDANGNRDAVKAAELWYLKNR